MRRFTGKYRQGFSIIQHTIGIYRAGYFENRRLIKGGNVNSQESTQLKIYSHFLAFLSLSEHWLPHFTKNDGLQLIIDNYCIFCWMCVYWTALYSPIRFKSASKRESWLSKRLLTSSAGIFPQSFHGFWHTIYLFRNLASSGCMFAVCYVIKVERALIKLPRRRQYSFLSSPPYFRALREKDCG